MQTTTVIVDTTHILKKSTSPIPTIMRVSFRPPCGNLPLKKAWKAIPDGSSWVLKIIEQGSSLQFTCRPLCFRGIIQTSVWDNNTHILWSEVQTLLAKGAVEMVPLANRGTIFTKCMGAALSTLRQMGIHIINYLENWLVLARSEQKCIAHRKACAKNQFSCERSVSQQ